MNDTSIRQRVRIRFRKSGDLRLIGHRDMVRAWERAFRRAELPLGMSEGFHPKPRMTFPSALGLGIDGHREVLELELSVRWTSEEVRERLAPHCPPGLELLEVEALADGVPKPKLEAMAYRIQVPPPLQPATLQAIENLLSRERHLVDREGRDAPFDLRPGLRALSLVDGHLQMELSASHTVSPRPREVLAALGLESLETDGQLLVRVDVVLAGERPAAEVRDAATNTATNTASDSPPEAPEERGE